MTTVPYVDPRPLIAHVIYRLDVGGLENGLVNLINTLPNDRFRHLIVTLAGYSDFRDRIQRPDVEVVSLDKRPGNDPRCYLRFLQLLRRFRPDIVHTRNLGTIDLQWMSCLAGTRVRLHGEHGWDASDIDGRNAGNLRIRRICAHAIQHFITMSKDLERWLTCKVGVGASRVSQIYNGVDTATFKPIGPLPADLPWLGESGLFVIGTVGRLERTKNQTVLIDAFARLRQRCPAKVAALRLVLAGDGPDQQALRQQVQALGLSDHTWFAGVRKDAPNVIRSLDVFVLPSLNEGISNTILEAMASGRPVVAGAVGGNPELVVPGVTGELFNPRNADDLADKLAVFVNGPTRVVQQGTRARQRAIGEFSLERMTRQYCELYERQSRDRH